MQDALGKQVTVIGAGMAGMAASVHLARAGFEVTCIAPEPDFTRSVGESLDWSAPELLRNLGLSTDRLLSEKSATYKRHVTLKLGASGERIYVPGDWLGQPPLNIELKTLHVDRTQLDAELRQIALSIGVRMHTEKVAAVETDGGRVLAVKTQSGARFSSPWFIDASGSGASLFPRAFRLPVQNFGPRKVAMWMHFDVTEPGEGTTIHADGLNPPYMNWVWEIPIRPNAISVGYVVQDETIKAQRKQGIAVEEIFRSALARFPRFEEFLQANEVCDPLVVSFQCRVHRGVAGANWVVVGEAAAMVDPMTSNGVTAALRHAEEASQLIIKARGRERLPRVASAMYSRRVRDLGRFFNSGIENVIYDRPIRAHIGALTAGDVYTVPAWSFNHLYSRFRPRSVAGTLLFGGVLGLLRKTCEICAGIYKRRTEVDA